MLPRLSLLLIILAVATGAVWRAQQLSARPLHADEAVQAWQTWQLLRGEGYRYDPVDRHGPWLYYGAAALEVLRGGDSAQFDSVRARAFVWLAGVLTLGLVAYASWRYLGPLAAAVSCALLAVEPFSLLYHSYFVQEAWLALFTWALLFQAYAWWLQPTSGRAVAVGLLAGLMQVTKETSVLHFAALAGTVVLPWIVWKRTRAHGSADNERSMPLPPPRQWLAGAGAALLIYVLFYSGFGSHPAGLWDGVRTYLHQWERSGHSPHEHPVSHYLMMLLPHREGGVRWGLLPLVLGAIGGSVYSWRQRSSSAGWWIATFTVLLFTIYSLIPYKTPWLLLTPVIGLTLLAGHGIAALARWPRFGPWAALMVAAVTVAQLVGQSRLSLGRYAGDARNPYFYQQTPRSFAALEQRLSELIAFDPTIAVISPDYAWPLPWYLRDHDQTAYFEHPPVDLARFDVVIWDSRIEDPEDWPTGSTVELHGLRPNVLLQLVIRPELWQQWERAHLP